MNVLHNYGSLVVKLPVSSYAVYKQYVQCLVPDLEWEISVNYQEYTGVATRVPFNRQGRIAEIRGNSNRGFHKK